MIMFVKDIYSIMDECRSSKTNLRNYFPDFDTCDKYSSYAYVNNESDEKVELCVADGFMSLDTFTYTTNQPIDSVGI